MYNVRFYELREYNDLFQRDVADKLNISQKTYSEYETCHKLIPLKHLNTLSNYYNISMDYIMGLSDIKNNNYYIKQLDKKVIGSNLKVIRSDNFLTIRELASILNTSASTISSYETGKTMILTAFAYQLCDKYNYSLDWLVGKSNIKYRNKITNKN